MLEEPAQSDEDEEGNKYAVYRISDRETHVVPCYSNGDALPEHTADIDCVCDPEIEVDEENEHITITHNQIH